MITFTINKQAHSCTEDDDRSLLEYLRDKGNFSVRDGCSGEGSCGACTVEINGKAKLACRTSLSGLTGADIITTEGLPQDFRALIGKLFAEKGAVQCGFCTPGFIMRARQLFDGEERPSRETIIRAINPNLCRCTGYIKIVDAIEEALRINLTQQSPRQSHSSAKVGAPYPKYQSVETALGERPFTDDLRFDGMLHGALVFSDHPRAKIKDIDTSDARAVEGVAGVFTAKDIPGEQMTGLIFKDWPMMIDVGEVTRYRGDVIAGIVADSEAIARKAASLIRVSYEVLDPVTDVFQAAKDSSPQVHPGRSNVLEDCRIQQGDADKAFQEAAYISASRYETQRVEHAFLETEAAVALPEKKGIRLYSQGQGVYVDRKQLAAILDIPEEHVVVQLVPNGGGFGGKEDLSVQGHAGLFAWLLQKPVKVHLTRQESIRMHPKRHPVFMDMQVACNKEGQLTAIRMDAFGDTGAYASVGTKVMERVVGHATGGYIIPAADISAKTIYTNNIPSGAMRGFGVPQVIFALESCVDDLCRQGGFDRWEFRYNNALEDGAKTATGQALKGVGLKKTLLAVKEDFQKARYAGIACAIKNSGVGNGMIDDSEVKIEITKDGRVYIHHGWTEMGQGVHTVAIQTLHQETGIDPGVMDVLVDTSAGVPTGMTTSSRGTALLGNAIIDAAKSLKKDIGSKPDAENLKKLAGRRFKGKYVCDWTSKPGENVDDPYIHFSYGYATQVVVLNDEGKVSEVIAAHDAGKIMNKMLFEGQIEGSVHMGLGYALTEDLPMKDGVLVKDKYKDLGILRANKMPPVKVIGIEEKDPNGPYGAKGIGEIGMVPTAAATANAYMAFDDKKRTKLPLIM